MNPVFLALITLNGLGDLLAVMSVLRPNLLQLNQEPPHCSGLLRLGLPLLNSETTILGRIFSC